MSAYVQSLKVLAENMRAALKPTAPCECDWCRPTGCVCADCIWRRQTLEQLEADVREVRADFDAVMDRGGEGW